MNITNDMFEQVTDWRFMKLLDKAMNYDEAKTVTTQKIKKPLKTSITQKDCEA